MLVLGFARNAVVGRGNPCGVSAGDGGEMAAVTSQDITAMSERQLILVILELYAVDGAMARQTASVIASHLAKKLGERRRLIREKKGKAN